MKEFAEKDVNRLAETIYKTIENNPMRFYDVLKMFENEEYRKILLAWGKIMEQKKVVQDEFGKWHSKSE